MKKKILLFLFLINHGVSIASGWQPLNNGVNRYVETVYIDSAENKLYVGGTFGQADSIRCLEIACWNGISWDSLAGGNILGTNNYAVIKYQNKIYSDGRYFFNQLRNNGGIFYNGTWDSLGIEGVDGPIYQFKEINGKLWVSGFFYNAGGNPCNMLAIWNGTSWDSCLNIPYQGHLYDFIFYNNQLVLGGSFWDLSMTNLVNIIGYDGQSYQYLSHPLYGLNSRVNAMAIYHGDLYVGGYFLQSDGNEGNHIMRWDGTTWHDVGGGTDYEVDQLRVYNDELYVAGGFQNAGGLHTGCLAKWNGSQWLPVTSSIISPVIYDFDFYGGDLYIGGAFTQIDSVQVNYIAKYENVLGINNIQLENQISIYPNPAKDKLTIHYQKNINRIFISDIAGKNLFMEKINSSSKIINLENFSPGIYFITIETGEGNVTKKFLKM